MSTPPFIPSGPLPSFLKIVLTDEERAAAELRGARPSRALVGASRDDELSDAPDLPSAPLPGDTPEGSAGTELLPESDAVESSSQRDAATNTRDACGTQNSEAPP